MLIEEDFIVLTEGNEEKKFPIVVSFDCEENGYSYIGYLDDGTISGEEQVLFGRYDTDMNIGVLYPISEDDELEHQMIEDVMKQGMQEA